MKRDTLTSGAKLPLCLFVLLMTCFHTVSAAQSRADHPSPLAMVADSTNKRVFIAEYGSKRINVFDTNTGKVRDLCSLSTPPNGLALSPDGARLYVTGATPTGDVYVIDTRDEEICETLRAGHTPAAPVVSPDGKTLYVCNRFNNDVSVMDLDSGCETAKIAVLREPVAAALTPNGTHLFVVNLLPTGAANRGYAAAAVSVIDTVENEVTTTIQFPTGTTGVRGICISPDGKYAYVTHILARYQLPTTQLDRGWVSTNALSVLNVARMKLVNTVLLDDLDLGAANPWGIACSEDGKLLCMTHAGTHELSVIDRAGLHQRLEQAARGTPIENGRGAARVQNDLAFLVGLRQRIKLAGNGPRGLAIMGNKAYVAEYFSDSIGVIDLIERETGSSRSIALRDTSVGNQSRRGELLFHDATMCYQQWQSCATCHPDGRVDGLNWDLLNDGIGNSKNTKSMLLAHRTPPAMSLGVRDTAETAVRAGIRFIQFTVRPEADAAAIDEYLKSLAPVPSPYLVEGQPSESARRGKFVFEKAGCATCHTQPLQTDLAQYDVGTGGDTNPALLIDTPTLVEVWRTAPYLHDGSAATLRDMLTHLNPDDRHGETSKLSPAELEDLINYLLTL